MGEGVALGEGSVGLPPGTAALAERNSALWQGVAALRQAALGQAAALRERVAARGGGAGTVGAVVLGELSPAARQGVAEPRDLPVVLRPVGAALGKRLASVRKRIVTIEQRVAKAGQHIALRRRCVAAPGVERLER